MIDFCVLCDPPTANHQSKKIVRVGGFTKLADKPNLVSAREFWTGILKQHAPPRPYVGATELTLEFTYPTPKSAPKKQRQLFRYPKTTKPDCSNAAKTVEDILVALRFIEDDRQVYSLIVRKYWGQNPGLHVTIKGVEQDVFDDGK